MYERIVSLSAKTLSQNKQAHTKNTFTSLTNEPSTLKSNIKSMLTLEFVGFFFFIMGKEAIY